MAIAGKLTAIGMIALSLGIGYLSFYLFSELSKEQQKKHLEEITSQLINLVLFIWLGKIVLNFTSFIKDPLSILAYPSDSKAFYFAIMLLAFWFLYKSKRKSLDALPLIESFVHIFLISSFVYEFMQIIMYENPYALGYLIELAILAGLFFFLRERLTEITLLMVIVTVWSLGLLVLAFVQPFVTVFGYMMTPWFVAVFFVMSIGGLTYKLRKRDA
jgi:hypothetical protein